MEKNIEFKIQNLLEDIQNKIKSFMEWCESPIEKILLLTFIEHSFNNMIFYINKNNDKQKLPIYFQECDGIELELNPEGIFWVDYNELYDLKLNNHNYIRKLIPQFKIQDKFFNIDYRIDFALFWPRTNKKGYIKIAIECDGHDFHEKTKEQAKRDKAKDRYLQSKGWIIARYTGSEIYKDPLSVLIDIEQLALSKDMEIFDESERNNND